MEFVEVRGRTVEVAVAGALAELGLESEEQAEIEIITEGKKGFLGVGGEDAVVRVRPKPAPKKKRRRRRGKGGGSKTGDQSSDQDRSEARPGSSGGRPGGSSSSGGRGKQQSSGGNGRGSASDAKEPEAKEDVAGQAEAVDSFLKGLVTAFGIEGNVSVDVQKDIITAAVDGDQTEALSREFAAVVVLDGEDHCVGGGHDENSVGILFVEGGDELGGDRVSFFAEANEYLSVEFVF